MKMILIILIRILAWHSKFSEELMPIAWHPKRWWNFCMSEDERREIEPIFAEFVLA